MREREREREREIMVRKYKTSKVSKTEVSIKLWGSQTMVWEIAFLVSKATWLNFCALASKPCETTVS